jgi:hypothetical protein
MLAAAAALASSPSSAAAQTILGPESEVKPGALELEAALDRLRDGWRWARVLAGEDAGPEAVADTIARMIEVPVKIGGLGRPADPKGRELAATIARTKALVRATVRAAFRDEGEAPVRRAELQETLDEYVTLLESRLARGATHPPSAVDR